MDIWQWPSKMVWCAAWVLLLFDWLQASVVIIWVGKKKVWSIKGVNREESYHHRMSTSTKIKLHVYIFLFWCTCTCTVKRRKSTLEINRSKNRLIIIITIMVCFHLKWFFLFKSFVIATEQRQFFHRIPSDDILKVSSLTCKNLSLWNG